tara:strand:- start:3500 stop:3943 length:444 start_codon:yes stop_codon:yes gene_type:complete
MNSLGKPEGTKCLNLAFVLLSVFLFQVLTSSCSRYDDAVKRYTVSGLMTYDGKPVPAGLVFFEPDSRQGNSGPGGVAEILDGHYQTKPNKGIVGGPHIVRVIGYMKPHLAKQPEPDLMFSEQRLLIDFPIEDNVSKDIDVHSSLQKK